MWKVQQGAKAELAADFSPRAKFAGFLVICRGVLDNHSCETAPLESWMNGRHLNMGMIWALIQIWFSLTYLKTNILLSSVTDALPPETDDGEPHHRQSQTRCCILVVFGVTVFMLT